MKCNCRLKNPHYKSTTQYYNATAQTLTATQTALNLGNEITDTGISLDLGSNEIDVNSNGTYAINATALVTASTAGVVTLGITLNGTLLPETVKAVTCEAGTTEIVINTIRYIRGNCENSSVVQIVAKTDGTAVGTATLAGNMVKLA